MTGDRDPDAAEVLCAACGGWFEFDGGSRSAQCPLCSASVVIGERRRARRRVRRTGVVDHADFTPVEERARRLRIVLTACAGFVVALVLAWLVAELAPPVWNRIVDRVTGAGSRK